MRTALGFPDGRATSIALDAEGRIVVGGWEGADTGDEDAFFSLVVARYHPDGSLDPTFGNDGIYRGTVGPSSLAFSVAIDNEGRIVVAGRRSAPNGYGHSDALVLSCSPTAAPTHPSVIRASACSTSATRGTRRQRLSRSMTTTGSRSPSTTSQVAEAGRSP